MKLGPPGLIGGVKKPQSRMARAAANLLRRKQLQSPFVQRMKTIRKRAQDLGSLPR